MRRILIAVSALALMAGTAAFAQERGQGQRGGQERGERGQDRTRQRPMDGERRFDPEVIRERMMDAMRQRLEADEEEWQVIQPKLERVMQASAQARAGGAGAMGMMLGGPGGPGGPGGQGGPGGRGIGGILGVDENSQIAQASRELRQTLQDENATADDIRQRLEAFRAARQQAEAELREAQEDLQSVLTQRQEAMLVMMGMLE